VVVKSIIFAAMMAALLPWQSGTTPKPAAAPDKADPGRTVFSAQCGKCHDADGSKRLHDGTTLLARLAKAKDPETRLGTRLKNEQERHQVFLYLQPMIERERSAESAKKTP
jgi:mono/diheme cytochrome c family protein